MNTLIDVPELDRLRHETARQQAEITRLAREVTLLLAELRRAEARRDDAIREAAELKQQVLRLAERTGATCASCGKPLVQPTTGRRARFCSNLCRLHFFRQTKQTKRNETKE